MENLYTVTIVMPGCVWTTPFSNEEKAEAFIGKVNDRLATYGVNDVHVSLDSMPLDREDYLKWLDEEYGELTEE